MIELLIAAALLACALLPILSMMNANVEMQRADRVRVFAEALAHDVLERFGRSQAYPASILQQSANPKLMVALDPWKDHPELFADLGYGANVGIGGQRFHMSVSLERGVAPELDLMICEVNWVQDGWTKRPEKYRYARFLTYGHMPTPR